jgi:predicted nucleotidyltransferase
MVKKKESKKSKEGEKSESKKEEETTQREPRTMLLGSEREIAMDFATKIYKEFDQMIKSVVLFGSSARQASTPTSDIDIIVIIDDVAIQWDEQLVAHYRETLSDIIRANPYRKALHINTVKLSTWWQDLTKGDPVVINILRYGDSLIDFGGFFDPLKVLLRDGKIKSTPESIYTLLQRAPTHMARTRANMLSAIDGLYWTAVDSAHAALISSKIMPPSPEHIPDILKEQFVDKKLLNKKHVDFYREIHNLAKDIVHGRIVKVKGKDIDEYAVKTEEFLREMATLVDKSIDNSQQ